MTLTFEFLIARADEAARDAEMATLDNVREKALRSEAAWRDMADRALKVSRAREQAQLERALASASSATDSGQPAG